MHLNVTIDPSWLVRRTSACEEVASFLRSFPNASEALRARVEADGATIERALNPGEELWTWDAGGWNELAGRSGLAIVREGVVVRAWVMMMS